jgi:hypothetical protein
MLALVGLSLSGGNGIAGGNPVVTTDLLLLSGDEQSGTDSLLLSGDEGPDSLQLSGNF